MVRRPCGDGPVHLPHVVARLVLAGISRLRTRTGNQAEMIAVQHTVEAAANRQLEGAQRSGEFGVAELAGSERRRRTGGSGGCRLATVAAFGHCGRLIVSAVAIGAPLPAD